MVLNLTLPTLHRLTSIASLNGTTPDVMARIVLLWAARHPYPATIRFKMRFGGPHRQFLNVPLDPEELGPVLDIARENGGFENPGLGGLIEACLETFSIRHPELVEEVT